jgi:hypothetical protein
MPPARVHKRSSMNHIYWHCVVFTSPRTWPTGVAACSHAEWVGSCALAARKASRWRREPGVEAIEILEARQVRVNCEG